MTHKGIRSPWAKPPPAPEDPLEGARPGKQPVRIQGRAYALIIELPIRIAEEKAKPLALNALGEALAVLGAEGPELGEELVRQKLALDVRPQGSCVSLPLGSCVLYALASSTDEALALAMTVDRLALALTRLGSRRETTRDTLKTHFVTLVRIT